MKEILSWLVPAGALAAMALTLAGCADTPPALRVDVFAKWERASASELAASEPSADMSDGPSSAASAPSGAASATLPAFHVALVHALAPKLTDVTVTLEAQILRPARRSVWQRPNLLDPLDLDPNIHLTLRAATLDANRLYVWRIDQFAPSTFDKCYMVTRVEIDCAEPKDVCPQHVDLPLQLPDPSLLDVLSNCTAPPLKVTP